LKNVSIADLDVLVIPKGARHPDQAFEFIRYVNQQGPMEKLCMGQRKFTPLVAVSPEFLHNHPNPYIGEFLALAHSPNIRIVPRVAVGNEYNDEMAVAYDRVTNFLATPQEALDNVQKRIGIKQDRIMRRWNLVSQARIREWGSE
jgi:multiple sugar transport system substrate-binding protein